MEFKTEAFNDIYIEDFYPKTFLDIPEKDNPAFDDNAECLMIVKDYTTDHAVVLYIKTDPIESVNHVASFWEHQHAIDYCNLVI